jgi:hypothetical protein
MNPQPTEFKKKLDREVALDEFMRERTKAEAEFAKLPPWIRAEREGDYMGDGSDSGMNCGDNIKEER